MQARPKPKPRKKIVQSAPGNDEENNSISDISRKIKPLNRLPQEAKPVQICYTEGDTERYVLDEIALRNILCREDLKDTPVAVYSLAGSFRKGKSFMLNLFMRHLQLKRFQTFRLAIPHKAGSKCQCLHNLQDGHYGRWYTNIDTLKQPCAGIARRLSPEWLQEKEASLRNGFQCKGGIARCTEGIWMWNEPFIVTNNDGKEVVVYLMDTQGTSDMKTGMTGNSVIFALSTLISSVQIFNLSQQVEAHDLQLLKLFTDYGKLATSEINDGGRGRKPFQSLMFLIRDWSDTDYQYGINGGRKYLKHVLEIKNKHIEELTTVRETIRDSFDDVECFLLPEPGKKISRGGSKTQQALTIGEMEEEFLQNVDEFVHYLFHEKVVTKQMNGEDLNGNDLLNLTIACCNIFNSDEFPQIGSIYKAASQAAIRKTIQNVTNFYLEAMDKKIGGRYYQDGDMKNFHESCKKQSLEFYKCQRKMGGTGFVEKMQEEVERVLENNFKWVNQKNNKYKAKAKAFWCKNKKKLCQIHYESMRTMWKPCVDAAAFACDCDKIAREKTLEKFNELLEGYPESFVRHCKEDLETELDKLLDHLKKHFIKAKEEESELIEQTKLRARNSYERLMEERFSLKFVDENEIEEYHSVVLEKVLNDFNVNERIVSKQRMSIVKVEIVSELEELKMKYLKNNKMQQKTEDDTILEVVRKAIDYYTSSMKVDVNENYISENDLQQKHEGIKSKALSQIRESEEKEVYEKCRQKADVAIESLFGNIIRQNNVRMNINIRIFKQQSATLLQSYIANMNEFEQSNVTEEELLEAHKREKSRVLSQFYSEIPMKEPKERFDHFFEQLEKDVSKTWNQIKTDRNQQSLAEADLAIETEILDCLNTIKEFMEDRHIKEEALTKLYNLSKQRRDDKFKKLNISKDTKQGRIYNLKFQCEYQEICAKNAANKKTCLQKNYDPFKDRNNSTMCPIL